MNDDILLAQALAISKAVRKALLGVARHTASVAADANDAAACAGMVLLRTRECLASVELLAAVHRERDAAVLLLTILELELDLRFIATQPSQASRGLTHTQAGRKPWTVHWLMERVFTDPNELASARDNYMHLSAIKHGNPAAGIRAFPVLFREGRGYGAPKQNSDFLIAYLSAAAFSAQGMADATATCTGHQIDSSDAYAAVKACCDRASSLLKQHLVHMITELGAPEA